MTIEESAIWSQIIAGLTFTVVALVALSLMARGNVVSWSDIPSGMPFVFLPVAYCALVLRYEWRLRRAERVRLFLQLADDLRVRKQRVYRLLPFVTRR